MSGIAALRPLSLGRLRTTSAAGWREAHDVRRALQLSLAGLWLLDGVLQFQPFMFTKDFARQVLAPSAHGNPAVIAGPITSVAHLVAQHSVGANAGFATAQVLLGLGIAWRPTRKAALAASMVWALSVWWLGEGLGGILTGQASPVAGGPGAALLYALLALVLWPPRERAGSKASGSEASVPPFVAASRLGVAGARVLWLVLWAALAGFALDTTNRSAQGLHDLLASMAAGQPGWLAGIVSDTAALVAHRGLAASVVLAVILVAIALGMLGSPSMARASVVLAVALSAVIWVAAQALGGLFAGQGTDPNTGPLLIVLALTYWPASSASGPTSEVGKT